MNWADWVIVGIFSLSCLIGVVRGFVSEAFSLIIWVTAALVARLFGSRLEVYLVDLIETPSVRLMAAYAILFVSTLLLGAMLSYLINALVRATGLSGTDRLLGMFFGAARAFIIVIAVLVLLPGLAPVNQDEWWANSRLIPHFLACEDWVLAAYKGVSQWLQVLFNNADNPQMV